MRFRPERRRWLSQGLAAWGGVALAGCGVAPATGDAVLAPNPNLLAQGIPPVPRALAQAVGRYTDFRGQRFVDWHPLRRELLVSHRAAGAATAQLFRVAAPGAPLERLTDGPDPVTEALYEPREGRYLVLARDRGGDEADQLYRLDLDSGRETLLTDPALRHDLSRWLHDGRRLLASAVPLDRTAQGGSRTSVTTTMLLIDPLAPPQDARRIAELPGGGWFPGGVSADDRRLALTHYLSAGESEVWLLDIASGRRERLLPAEGAPPATHFAGEFTPDGRALFVISDREGEFRELLRVPLDGGPATRVTGHIPWDVSEVSVREDGSLVAACLNVDGKEELRLFDGASLRELPPPAAPPGSVTAVHFERCRGELALAVNNAQGPSQVWSLDPASARLEVWARAEGPPGLDTAAFAEPAIVRWPSFDGRVLSGLLHRPPARFPGRRPVLVDIHGGPEGQAQFGFLGRWQYFVQELGLALLRPNVRGSSGYGKTFLSLDNGLRREDAVRDIAALFDWIATQPGLDASRVVVSGGSYGGYMSLAVAATMPERIAGAIDVVGISHFVTFLERTESYRRDLRRVEYGDERDPDMRAFLDRISPLTNASRIRKPLFVVQGRNDPRVPYSEAEQIVERVRANGVPVWYLRAENEGHGFARKDNADFQFYATILFLRQCLGLGG